MGRIRTTWIKNVTRELVEGFPKDFSVDFEINKKSIDKLGIAESKKMRNRIAGAIVSSMKKGKL